MADHSESILNMAKTAREDVVHVADETASRKSFMPDYYGPTWEFNDQRLQEFARRLASAPQSARSSPVDAELVAAMLSIENDGSQPIREQKERLLWIMGEYDFSMPVPAFDMIAKLLAQSAGSEQQGESLPDFLDRMAVEIVARDTRPGNFAQGVAESLRGRAIILRNVDSKRDAGKGEGVGDG